jgi:hypothetical protein
MFYGYIHDLDIDMAASHFFPHKLLLVKEQTELMDDV